MPLAAEEVVQGLFGVLMNPEGPDRGRLSYDIEPVGKPTEMADLRILFPQGVLWERPGDPIPKPTIRIGRAGVVDLRKKYQYHSGQCQRCFVVHGHMPGQVIHGYAPKQFEPARCYLAIAPTPSLDTPGATRNNLATLFDPSTDGGGIRVIYSEGTDLVVGPKIRVDDERCCEWVCEVRTPEDPGKDHALAEAFALTKAALVIHSNWPQPPLRLILAIPSTFRECIIPELLNDLLESILY